MSAAAGTLATISGSLVVVVAVVAVAIGLVAGGAGTVLAERRRRHRALSRDAPLRRIALPFTRSTLSEDALVTALRVARAENATLVPVYLALVPRDLPLDVPLRAECETVLPMLEAIERRAQRAHVPADSRIERGRTVRHALSQLIEHEGFERMVVAAAPEPHGDGFSAEDVAWLLIHAPSEVVALRPRQTAGSPFAKRELVPSQHVAEAIPRSALDRAYRPAGWRAT